MGSCRKCARGSHSEHYERERGSIDVSRPTQTCVRIDNEPDCNQRDPRDNSHIDTACLGWILGSLDRSGHALECLSETMLPLSPPFEEFWRSVRRRWSHSLEMDYAKDCSSRPLCRSEPRLNRAYANFPRLVQRPGLPSEMTGVS